jgi:hypothetical protein
MPAQAQIRDPATTTVTVVRSVACHLCDDAEETLAKAAATSSIRIDLVEAASPAGMELVSRYRPAAFPLVLVDGRFFSQGRLPRGKLRAVLATRGEMSPR